MSRRRFQVLLKVFRPKIFVGNWNQRVTSLWRHQEKHRSSSRKKKKSTVTSMLSGACENIQTKDLQWKVSLPWRYQEKHCSLVLRRRRRRRRRNSLVTLILPLVFQNILTKDVHWKVETKVSLLTDAIRRSTVLCRRRINDLSSLRYFQALVRVFKPKIFIGKETRCRFPDVIRRRRK